MVILPQFLHMVKLGVVKHIPCLVLKKNWEEKFILLMKQKELFQELRDIYGKQWPKEKNNFMLKPHLQKYIMNNYTIY